MSYTDSINAIEKLEHFPEIQCNRCRHNFKLHALQIYACCPKCGNKWKRRGMGSIGSEIEDVVDAVLEWIGNSEGYIEVMKRHREICGDK